MDNASDQGNEVKKPSGKPKRTLNNGIWNHAILAIGVGVFGLLCTFALLWWQFVVIANEDHRTAQVQARHAGFVGYFNSRITGLKRQIAALAAAPSTVEALLSYDPDRIHAANLELTALLGYARRVDIIPKGTAEVDLNAEVPISFAALHVIKRAETQEFVGPEMSLNQRDLVYVAHPITNQGVMVGVLFVALSRDYFFDPLRSYDTQLGRLNIVQVFDDSATPVKVLEWGTASNGSNSVFTIPLETSGWHLVFEPNEKAIDDLTTLTQLLTPLAVALAMLIGGASLAFSSLSRKLEKDSNTLVEYASRLMRGRSTRFDSYRLPLFQQIAEGMRAAGDAAPTVAQHGKIPDAKSNPGDKQAEVDKLLTDQLGVGSIDHGEEQGNSCANPVRFPALCCYSFTPYPQGHLLTRRADDLDNLCIPEEGNRPLIPVLDSYSFSFSERELRGRFGKLQADFLRGAMCHSGRHLSF